VSDGLRGLAISIVWTATGFAYDCERHAAFKTRFSRRYPVPGRRAATSAGGLAIDVVRPTAFTVR